MAKRNPYFQQVLNEWLEAKGANAPKLADMLECSRSAAYQYTEGRVPEWDLLLRLSRLMGRKIEQLLDPQSETDQGMLSRTTDALQTARGEPIELDTAEAELLVLTLELLRDPKEGPPTRHTLQRLHQAATPEKIPKLSSTRAEAG